MTLKVKRRKLSKKLERKLKKMPAEKRLQEILDGTHKRNIKQKDTHND